jgi:hypothetical protein
MADTQKQLLCTLYYPHQNLSVDKVALVAIELGDWAELCESLHTDAPQSALLECISKDFPIHISRERLHSISESISAIENMKIPQNASLALFTLKTFIQQAMAQPKADILIEVNSGEYLDEQWFITAPVFDDLVEINRLIREENTSGLWHKIKSIFGKKLNT